MKPRIRQDSTSSPLDQAARLGVRDRIVALGHGLRSAPDAQRETQAMMLIELAAQGQAGASPTSPSAQAAGPIELLARIPSKWRERHADEALLTLARSWSVLPSESRRLALALGRDRWLLAARTLSEDPDPDTRMAALELANVTADPGLGKIVCRMLADEEQRVRHLADEVILRMALRQLRDLPPEVLGKQFAAIASTPAVSFPVDPEVLRLERSVLLRAIADAAWSFAAHRCRSPLIAVLLLMDHPWHTRMEREICTRMRRLLSQRQHPSHAPLRSVLKRTDCPLLRERSLRWLSIDAISNAALERLRVAETPIEHAIVLEHALLALRPKRAAKLASVSSPRLRTTSAGMLPGPEKWRGHTLKARVGLLTLDALLGDDDDTRRARIEPALADASALVRMRSSSLCPPMDLQDYLFDADPSVSRHAMLRWSTVGVEPPRVSSPACSARLKLCALSGRSAHVHVRRLASEEFARLSVTDPRHPASRARARRAYESDPSGTIRLFRDRLALAESCVDTIMMIRMLGIEKRFELDLIGLVQSEHTDPKALASAVAALSRVETNAARYVLSESLSSKDDRTRANAIELAPMPVDSFIEFRDDPHHRVRANAVRRLIGNTIARDHRVAHEASGSLIELLGDPRPMHRLAGAWVAQRVVTSAARDRLGTRWSPIVAQLEELAATDENPALRDRASRCIRRLTHEIRSGSASSARGANDVA
jgi:hypothetical protein